MSFILPLFHTQGFHSFIRLPGLLVFSGLSYQINRLPWDEPECWWFLVFFRLESDDWNLKFSGNIEKTWNTYFLHEHFLCFFNNSFADFQIDNFISNFFPTTSTFLSSFWFRFGFVVIGGDYSTGFHKFSDFTDRSGFIAGFWWIFYMNISTWSINSMALSSLVSKSHSGLFRNMDDNGWSSMRWFLTNFLLWYHNLILDIVLEKSSVTFWTFTWFLSIMD